MKEFNIKFLKRKKSISKTRITKSMVIKSLIWFIIIFAILLAVVYKTLQDDIGRKKNEAKFVTEMTFDKMSVNLQIIEARLKTLSNFTIDSEGNVNDLQRTAEDIIGNDYVRYIALAPAGVVKYVFPNDNMPMLGFDFLSANYSKKETSIGGPYLFRNGKVYIAIMVPIYDQNANQEKLWGVGCALMDFPDSLMKNGLDLLVNQKYNYKLYKYDDNNNEKVILSSHKNNIEQGIIIQHEMLNETWYISIEPENGWYNEREYVLEYILVIVISLLIATTVFNYLRLKETGKILTRIVNIDTLTGVFSRKYFYDYVDAQIQRNKSFSIFYIDVDKFKEVNDIYGHETGDKLLFEIANRIQDCIRKNDFVSRIGGDEFIVYIGDINEQFNAEVILSRLIDAMEKPVILKHITVQNNLSIGYATYPKDGSTIEELIQKADRHMYNMKEENHIKYVKKYLEDRNHTEK